MKLARVIPRVHDIKATISMKMEWVSYQKLYYDLSIRKFKYINILYKGVDIYLHPYLKKKRMISLLYYYQQWRISSVFSHWSKAELHCRPSNNILQLVVSISVLYKSSCSLIKFLLLPLPCQLEIQLISSKWISSQRRPPVPLVILLTHSYLHLLISPNCTNISLVNTGQDK